jgi:hypothetical protein
MDWMGCQQLSMGPFSAPSRPPVLRLTIPTGCLGLRPRLRHRSRPSRLSEDPRLPKPVIVAVLSSTLMRYRDPRHCVRLAFFSRSACD